MNINRVGWNALSTTLFVCILAFGINKAATAASTVMVSGLGNNDCSGYFGTGFDNCQIFDGVQISPVIIGFDNNLNPGEINSAFPSITGSEWTFSNLGSGNSTGDWSYTPGANDPGVRYWVAKATNDFNLFWTVDDSALSSNGGVCDITNAFTLNCLNEALVVNSGSWTTPVAGSGPASLSHLTFYDHEPAIVVPPTSAPEPNSLLLMSLGALGFGFFGRRKKQI